MNEVVSPPDSTPNRTTVARKSDRELVATRSFDAPACLVYQAWTDPELFRRWWVPRSMEVPLLACDMDVRPGGTYRLVFGRDASESMTFFGKYLEAIPHSRLVWTNDESEDGAITTVTFADQGGTTLLTFQEHYPAKEALDEAMGGGEGALPEQFTQLDELLLGLRARRG